MTNAIDTSKVKFKYFYLNGDGKVGVVNVKPEGKNPLAIINTSLFFSDRKSDTAIIMQQNINTFLNHKLADGSKAGERICITVPCDNFDKMKEYYGEENIKKSLRRKYSDDIETKYEELKPYISLKMHDDLDKGNDDYNPYLKDDRMAGSLSALESAEQLASAIERGYDVWSYGGGSTGHQTFELGQEYFDENYDRLKSEGKLQKRVLFGGFSNGTTGSFALRGIINPFLSFTFGWQMASKRMAEDIGDKTLLQHRNVQIDAIVLAVEGRDVRLPERNFKCDPEDFSQIQERKSQYESAIAKECKVTNLACYAGQLVPASTGKLGQFSLDEMIILGLESFQDKSFGFEPDQALKRFLQSGKINPAQILFIEIGDIIRSFSPTNTTSEMFNIPRENGFIADFENLTKEEQEIITKLKGEKTPQEYITYSNLRTREIINDIKNVAIEFGIPVVMEMGRAIGHGKYCTLVPTDFDGLRFDSANHTIEQTPILTSRKLVEKPIPILLPNRRLREERDYLETPREVQTQITQELNKDLEIVQIGGNTMPKPNDVILGRPLKLIDLDPIEVQDKDLAIYLPNERGFVAGQEQFVVFLSFFASNKHYQPKSITLIQRFNNYEGRNYLEDMRNRDSNYALLIQNTLGTDSPPIFMSHASVDLDRVGDFHPTRHILQLQTITPSQAIETMNSAHQLSKSDKHQEL